MNIILNNLKDSFDTDVRDKIDAGKKSIIGIFDKGNLDITNNYKLLEEETINKINEYKNELVKLKQNMKFLDEKFAKRFDEKLVEFDNKFGN